MTHTTDEMKLPRRGSNYKRELKEFADTLKQFSDEVGFKISARGWAYHLETVRLINKDQFDLVESLINQCRKNGMLPVDFVAEEDARKFSGVEEPDESTPEEETIKWLHHVLNMAEIYTPDWWDGEKYYIQMLVEKIDLKTLFMPICEEYHIPISTAKGWSSILQRAEYARRFSEAEERGLKCVLLYGGDFDPDGLRISDFILENLRDIQDIEWEDGMSGYDPSDLVIDRFCLNYDYIMANNLVWIDNLITGSGGEIAKVVGGRIVQGRSKNGQPHKNFNMDYIQNYLKKYGVRKCEANSILKQVNVARHMCRESIEKYLGPDATDRFEAKREAVRVRLGQFRQKTGLDRSIREAIKVGQAEIDDGDDEDDKE